MAITSGVRRCRAYVSIGSKKYPVDSATVEQSSTRESSTFSAHCALNTFQGGDAFFASLSSIDAAILVSVGAGNETLIDGELDRISIDYGGTTIDLSGRCKSSALHNHKSAEQFRNQTRAEVVEKVAKRNGLSANIAAATLKAGKIFATDWIKLTDGISDAAILHKIAELENARWWVKGSELFFQTTSQGGSYKVIWSAGPPAASNCLSLSISKNVQASKTINVTVKGWHTKKKKVIQGKATIEGTGGDLSFDYRSAGIEQDHADDLAKKKAAEHARHEISLSAEMVGDPSIDVAMKVQLQGTAFDQALDIESISHQISVSGGYTMYIQAKSAKEGRTAS